MLDEVAKLLFQVIFFFRFHQFMVIRALSAPSETTSQTDIVVFSNTSYNLNIFLFC